MRRCSFEADKGAPVQKAKQVFSKVAKSLPVKVANKRDIITLLPFLTLAIKRDVVTLVSRHF